MNDSVVNITKVKKRDGRKQKWNIRKVEEAILQSAQDAEEVIENLPNLLEKVSNKVCKGEAVVDVEVVHKAVEDVLMASKHKNVARQYISYRAERDAERSKQSKFMQQVDGLINQSDENVLNENANKSSRIVSTHRDLLAGLLSKDYAKLVLSKNVQQAEALGKIWVHDKDYLISGSLTNCGVYDYEGMLRDGFVLGNADVESPNSIGVATTILSQIASTISGSSYGGQSIHRYNELLKPYAEKSLKKLREDQKIDGFSDARLEEKLRKEIYDAHQTFLYQINTICGPNGQSAFCAISLYPSDDPLVRIITEEYLKCHIRGLGGKRKTSVFPKVLYFVEEGKNLNKEDPNYEEFQLALECTAKRCYPDYLMLPKIREMTGMSDGVTNMGCRSFVPKYIQNGKEKYLGRFNVGVVSVNVPMAAAEAKGNKERFFKVLRSYCDIAFDAHMTRINRLKKTKAKENPIIWMEGALARLDAEDSIEPLIYNGNATASLGYIGIYEAQELCGDISKEFGIEIVKFMQEVCAEWYEKTNIYFSVYGTPSENLCYTFANKFKEQYPELNFQHDYLTNSFHLPVRQEIDFVQKFEYESDFYKYSSGGVVNNVELPNMQNNIKGLESVVRVAYDKVPYLIVNTPVDQCFKCGFEGEFNCTADGFTCPKCGNQEDDSICVIRRVSGYISSPNSRPFNKGKQSEVKDRVKHCEVNIRVSM